MRRIPRECPTAPVRPAPKNLTAMAIRCLTLLCLAPAAFFTTTTAQTRSLIEERLTFPASIENRVYQLEAMVYRPDDGGRYPLVIFSHGRNGPHPDRNPNEVYGYATLCRALASEGLAVVFVVRRGYGNSDGPDSELQSTAVLSGLEAAKDYQAAVEYWQTQGFVLPDRVVLMGHSQGGWSALACSTVPMDGVLGVVNISGATNYALMGSGSITPVVQAHWVEACREFGHHAVVPSYWIYAENDPTHPGPVSRRMFEAYNATGGLGFLLMLPAYGTNGHYIIREPDLFLPQLNDFLATIGIRDEAVGVPSFVSVTGGGAVSPGNTAVFVAHLTANPLPTLQWRKDGIDLQNSAKIAGATSSALSVLSAQTQDAGLYDVVATNFLGTATSTPLALTVSTSTLPPPTPPSPPPPSPPSSGGGAPSFWFVAMLVALAGARKVCEIPC